MHVLTFLVIAFLVCFMINYGGAIEPISMSIGAAALALGGYNFDYLKGKTYCKFAECCSEEYIPADISLLESLLESALFGQHLVLQQLVPALKAHFSESTSSKKALVLSFHGTPGTGKSYVADFITKSIYKKGIDSQYVHFFNGRSDFPLQAQSEQYSIIIRNLVEKSVNACPKSLFIFNEVDKMPDGIFETLTALVNYHSSNSKTNYKNAIFVFISNTAGVEIGTHLGQLLIKGKQREQTKISDFEKILELASYNLEGGMKKASLIESHVIDHYIPFLPLEREHVYDCMKAEFLRWHKTPNKKTIEDLIDTYVPFEKQTGLFATSGCKRLDKIVGIAAKSI